MRFAVMRLFLLASFVLSACAPTSDNVSETMNLETMKSDAANYDGPSTDPSEPYSRKLRWMLERSAYAEDPDVPCLRREVERPAWVEEQATRTRMREVRSDSYWLGDWARKNLGDRLAYATVTYDWTPGPGRVAPVSPPPLIYEIAVTGNTPVNPPALGGRARGVPVRIVYDVPYSHEEFMERRRIGSEASRELVDKIGEGGSPENGWAVRMDVFSENGEPDPRALAQCDRLRRLYDLPILMDFGSARITLD